MLCTKGMTAAGTSLLFILWAYSSTTSGIL